MNGAVAREGWTTAWSEQIAGGPAAARAVRALLSERIGAQLAPERLHDVLLLATELVTNAVLHAGVDESKSFELRASAAAGVVRVGVTDPGAKTEPRVQELDPTLPGGMGLFLVDQLSDRWGVDHGSAHDTEVWFEVACA